MSNLSTYPEVFQMEKLYGVSGSKFQPIILFSFERFQQLILGNLDKLTGDFESLQNFIVREIGFSKPEYRVQNSFKNEFAFVLVPQGFFMDVVTYKLYLCNTASRLTLINRVVPVYLPDREKLLKTIKTEIDLYHSGFVHCHVCGKAITIEEAKGNDMYSDVTCDLCTSDEREAMRQAETYE